MQNHEPQPTETGTTLQGTVAKVFAAYVGNNTVSEDRIGEVMQKIAKGLLSVEGGTAAPEATSQEPAVAIKKSVQPDHIVCLEDGKKFKSLKRHLRTRYNLSPDEYRAKWGLPFDYPMVAPNYAKERSNLAKRMGLGTKK